MNCRDELEHAESKLARISEIVSNQIVGNGPKNMIPALLKVLREER